MMPKQTSKSHAFWYRLCRVYTEGRYTSQMSFLQSKDSGEEVSDRHQQVFNRYLRNTSLVSCLTMRPSGTKKTMYDEVKEQLLNGRLLIE
jgi:hypothetical protein